MEIGKKIGNYVVKQIANGYCFAINYNRNCMEPFVIWNIDHDGNGVWGGRYYGSYNTAIRLWRKLVASR